MRGDDDRVRIDKWLWAARMFATRGLASEAVRGGRVHVNDQRAKPSREVRVGETIRITRPGARPMVIVVQGVSARRGPATQARQLYAETPESARAREEERLARRMAPPPPGADLGARPTKRDRRRFEDARRRSR